MLFDAIFKQGLARPERGIRAILDPLCKKLKELGIERRMNAGVKNFMPEMIKLKKSNLNPAKV